jgi:sulfur relay (sulfurtransferase) complex TusBCD TusD component (DsrE family)
MNRCGLSDADAITGTEWGSMDDLVAWIDESDRVVTF